MIDNQNCYAKHKNDVGKISTPFRIGIKDNCKLQTQRPSKVPIHYRDRLNKLLLELEKYNIIKQIGSTSDEKHTIGTTFLNPLIIIPKGDAINVNQTQRPSKVPIHYRDRLNKLLLELEKYNIIKQIGSTSDEKHTIGTTFLNPLIIIPKGDAIKVVFDARHLNSNTNQELESWPIEPLAPQLARANKNINQLLI